MDSGDINKVAGAFIGALLFFLLLGFFSEKIFRSGHEEDVLAWAIEIEEADDVVEEEVEEVNLAALAANADPGAGESIYRKCSACHKIEDGANAVGPHLWNVVGREIASVADYSYSDSLGSKEGVWDLETLSAWLENPNEWAPGNKMGNSGAVEDPEDRVNLIAYLNEADGTPIELAAAPAETEMASAEEMPAEETPAEEMTETAEAEAPAEATEEEPATETAEAEAPADATEEETATETAEAEAPAEATEEDAATETAEAEAPADATEEDAATETAEAEAPAEAAEEETMEVAAAEPAAEAEPAAAGGGSSIYATADAAEGEKVFRKCRACHVVEDGKNRVGPHLWNVVGREVASVDGFNYSSAMKEYGGEWTPERLDAYLEDPRNVVKGTKMVFAGLRDEADRANVIKYLNEAGDSPVSLD